MVTLLTHYTVPTFVTRSKHYEKHPFSTFLTIYTHYAMQQQKVVTHSEQDTVLTVVLLICCLTRGLSCMSSRCHRHSVQRPRPTS